MTPQYVRVHHHRLQTPVQRYEHPETGRVVTVIGTHHFADAAYFQGLREVIDKLEANGAVVQCERSGRKSAYTDATTQEQPILDQLHRAHQLTLQRVPALGWTHQVQGLGYPEHWHTVDLDPLEVVRRLGLPLAQRLAARQLSRVDWPEEADRKGFNQMRLGIAVMLRVASTDERIIKYSNSDATDEVIIAARNQIALEGVDGTDQDVVLIWGLMHLPGLHTGLTERGFHRAGTPQWHTAVKRRPSILGALLRMILRWPAPKIPASTATGHQGGQP